MFAGGRVDGEVVPWGRMSGLLTDAVPMIVRRYHVRGPEGRAGGECE